MISWTLARPQGPSEDGNFFISDYRIKIASAANSCVGWQPEMGHGTSLRDYSPETTDPPTLEVGLSFALSPNLATRWANFLERKGGQKELEKNRKESAERGEGPHGEEEEKEEGELDM